MSRIVYVNGNYLPEDEATISIFDRGFLFADGVYEVSSVLRGKLVDNSAHEVRLQRSLTELSMTCPVPIAELEMIQNELINRNNMDEGIVYMQITRGAADRDFLFPKNSQSTLVMFTQKKSLLENTAAKKGISVVTVDDIRWKRRDIKTVGLLASSLAKQQAYNAGADDAWLVEDGFITEGPSNNAYIVTNDGTIITRNLSNEILHGITRKAVIRLAETSQIKVEERPFTLDEALQAREAFITSASSFVMPVVKINDIEIGDGTPGSITQNLRNIYIDEALNE